MKSIHFQSVIIVSRQPNHGLAAATSNGAWFPLLHAQHAEMYHVCGVWPKKSD
jgi:hypothetical protein